MASEILIAAGVSVGLAVFFLAGAFRAHCRLWRHLTGAEQPPRDPR